MKEITLTRGYVALVDDDMYATLSQYKWQAGRYAQRTQWLHVDGRRTSSVTVLMHRLIISVPSGFETDHINGNRYDNRRDNLRISTRSENLANRRKFKNCSSQYKGVTCAGSRWTSAIKVNSTSIHLGTFLAELDAARAYDAAAREHFGEFAYLNFPDQEQAA